MNPIRELVQDAKALALFKDWLGDGLTHVSQEKAGHRSLACLCGKDGWPCPHNRAPKWWESAKSSVAGVMRQQLQLKSKAKLSTAFDHSLNVCDVCGCCLQLVIWTPIDRIKEHTTKEQISKFPNYCWQKIEVEL